MPKPKRNIFSTPLDQLMPRESSGLFLACFLLLILSNALISYFKFSTTADLWIGTSGILFPLLLAFSLPFWDEERPADDFLPAVPTRGWLALLLAALFLHLYRLTSLSAWPVVDEGMYGYFATLLEEKWNWHLLQYTSQEPILYTWGQFLFFKLFGNSRFSLWLFPALCSLACVPVAWFCSRRFFSRPAAFIVTCWTALGFWPLFMGRLSIQSVLMVLWEGLTFYALGCYRSCPSSRKGYLPALAAVTGLGFYIYLAWPVVALMVFLAVLWISRPAGSGRLKSGLIFAGVAGLCVLPLILDFGRDYRGYLGHLWAFHSSESWATRLRLPLSYFNGLFWGNRHSAYSSGPLWGGFFNPILASLCLLGLVSVVKSDREPLSLWLMAALVVFFLPAALTNNLEMMRLTPLLPVLIAVTALGTQFFLAHIPRARRFAVFLCVLAASSALDFYHLFTVYPSYWSRNPAYYGAHKSLEFYRAFLLLKPLAESRGPGLILLNFNPDPYDQTLFVITHSFNAAENPALKPGQAKWAAVLTNVHEEPYLKKRFPDGKGFWLSQGLDRMDGGFFLEVVPVNAQNRDLLEHWTRADQSLGELTYLVMETGVNPDQKQMLAVLEKAYPYFKGHPLLESRYWRIRAVHESAQQQIGEAVKDEERALRRGYPMAHLDNEMGCLLFKEGKWPEAGKAFESALRLKPNRTDAGENLKNLLLMMKQRGPVQAVQGAR